MNLRGYGVFLRGKVVGREGVEPSTKRLRVGRLYTGFTQKTALFPLSMAATMGCFSASFAGDLRDFPNYLADRMRRCPKNGRALISAIDPRNKLLDGSLRRRRSTRTYALFSAPQTAGSANLRDAGTRISEDRYGDRSGRQMANAEQRKPIHRTADLCEPQHGFRPHGGTRNPPKAPSVPGAERHRRTRVVQLQSSARDRNRYTSNGRMGHVGAAR